MEFNRVALSARRLGVPSFALRHPLLSAGLVAMPVAGAIAGAQQASRDRERFPDMLLSERASRAAGSATAAAIGAGALGGVGYLAWRNRGSVSASARASSSWAAGRFADTFRSVESTRTAMRAAGASHVSAALRSYGGSYRMMLGGGALVGAAIGSAYGEPGTGAAIGAGAGLAVRMGLGAQGVWRTASRVPGGRTAMVLAASTMLYHGVQAAVGSTPAVTAYGAPDGMGGYEYSDRPTVKDRMNTIGATGDLAFGLHSRRHS